MRADVNVKQIVVTTIIVVLTVAGMYAVLIVAWSFVNGQYLRKTLIDFPDPVGAEVLLAKDPPTPKVRRPSAPVHMVSPDEEIESNPPSNPPKKVVPGTEAQHDDTMGDLVGAKVLPAKDSPAPKTRRPTEPVIATSPDGKIESNTPSKP